MTQERKRLTREDRQRILNEYLEETGADMYRVGDFLDWLEPKTEHPAWPMFFGRDEADLARERREQMARQFVSDLRIKIRYSEKPVSGPTIIRVVKVPAYVSPVNCRVNGGGYALRRIFEALRVRSTRDTERGAPAGVPTAGETPS